MHRSAFNAAMMESTESQHSKMMTDEKFTRIFNFRKNIDEGQSLYQLKQEGYQQAFQWGNKYKIVCIEGVSTLLQQVSMPCDQSGKEIVWKEVLHTDTIFDALITLHLPDHAKGRTLFNRMKTKYANVTVTLCKMFSSTCPQVIFFVFNIRYQR